MYNYMVVQIQIFKLQMQPQSVSVSGLSLFKVTSQKIFVLADPDPDFDPFQAITQVFKEYSDFDPHTSRLQTQTRFVTPLSCDIKLEITKPTSQNIFVSADLGPDIIPFQAIAQVFSKPSNYDPITSCL